MKVSMFYIKRLVRKAVRLNIDPSRVLESYEGAIKNCPHLSEKEIADHMSSNFEHYTFMEFQRS